MKPFWYCIVLALMAFALYDGIVRKDYAKGCFFLLLAHGVQRSLEREEDEERRKSE